jgi:hypothetical protein
MCLLRAISGRSDLLAQIVTPMTEFLLASVGVKLQFSHALKSGQRASMPA